MKGRPTAHPHYINDGCGRDTYISFFNGGFHNYPYSNSYKKDFFEITNKRYHADLFKRRPIIKYIMDGKGRDFFIYQNILSEFDKINNVTNFPNTLRTSIDLPPIKLNKSCNTNRLRNRIYYESLKDKNLKQTAEEDKKENDYSLDKADNNVYQQTENDRYETNPNVIDSYNDKKKECKSCKKYKPRVRNENNEENLVNSINNIFMFNHNRIKSKELEKENSMHWI